MRVLCHKTAASFGWLYFLFAVMPAGLLARGGTNTRNWLVGLAAVLFCVGPLMVATLNPDTNARNMDFYMPYFAALHVVIALLTGLGLVIFGSILGGKNVESSAAIRP